MFVQCKSHEIFSFDYTKYGILVLSVSLLPLKWVSWARLSLSWSCRDRAAMTDNGGLLATELRDRKVMLAGKNHKAMLYFQKYSPLIADSEK